MSQLKSNEDFIKEILDFIVVENQTTLPEATDDGTAITWSVITGKATISGNKLIKKDNAKENEVITLQAQWMDDDQTCTYIHEDLILKDPYVAHLMTYFNHDEGKKSGTTEGAGMRLAYSYDGIDWFPLNNGKAVVNATLGTTNWLRDPHAFRKKDGSFGVVSTQGWDTPYIFMWDTDDMVTFNEHILQASRKGPVNDNKKNDLSGKRAWAPKVMYSKSEDLYYVFWADPMNPHGLTTPNSLDRPIYYNATKDFSDLSEPGVYFSADYPVIDATIVKDQGRYYMFYKDERKGEKCIRVAVSNSLAPESFIITGYLASDPKESVEGPFAFQSLKDHQWYVYFDDFADTHTYKYSTASSPSSDTWEQCGICNTLPIHKLDYKTRISHGGQVTITQKELDRILTAWNV